MYIYQTQGVCSQAIGIELDGDRIENIAFNGGCQGNLKAISALVEGMTIDEVIAKLEGLTCGHKNTSCADQMIQGIKEAQQATRS